MNALLNVPAHTGCVNCGDCCGIILVSPEELKRIKDYVAGRPEIRSFANDHRSLEECPFRDDEAKRCKIYPVRPMICRLMGICKGMRCAHGNSAEVDGREFLEDFSLATAVMLNTERW